MPAKPNVTKEVYVAQLTRVGVWATPGSPIQYAFLEQKPSYLPNEQGWVAFSAAQRAAVQNAFAMISEVVNLTFVQVADNQQQPGPSNPRIAFYANSINLNYSGSMYPYQLQGSDAINGADIRLNNARIAQRQANEGFNDFTSFVALHEVLHAVGLSHPGEYNGQGYNYQDHAEFVEDTIQYSVMSYWAAAEAGADHVAGFVQYVARTPLLYDILALQSLYSPNMTTRTGDTVYGFNSNTGATSPFNLAFTVGPVVAIWDAGGTDTIDLSGYSEASLIDLNEGAFSDAGGLTRNIAIAFGVTIENAVGGPGNDRLIGNQAANRLDGGAGADLMEGGSGSDVYIVDNSGDVVVELTGAGSDEVRTALATYVLPANVEVLTGISASAQTLGGNELANSIAGGAGDDTLTGAAGDDSLEGGAGDGDTALYAGNRADYEIGTGGQVTVRDLNAANGDEGTDTLSGIEFLRFADVTMRPGEEPNRPPQLGNPRMDDQAWGDGAPASYTIPESSFLDLDGNHTLSFQATLADGSPLPAWLSFDAAARTFRATPPVAAIGATLAVLVTANDGSASVSDEFLIGVTQSPGADVQGTAGDDLLEGTFRNEVMTGIGGGDVLRGSPGADRLDGGAGVDLADYSASPQAVTIDLSTRSGLGGDAEGDELISIERLTGSAFSDRLIGGVDADRFDGGAGADVMQGRAGADTYVVDDALDQVIENAGDGVDSVESLIARYALPDHLENLILTGAAAIEGTGNALDNVLTGNSAANVLDGAAGADEMAGGLGDDTYGVDNASDRIVESAGGGTDTVRSSIGYILGAELENLTLTGLAAIDGTGNALANVLTGNDAANRLDGGAGADSMYGGLGDDTYVIDNDFDSATETSASGGTDTIISSVSGGLWENIENLTLTGTADLLAYGNALDNVLWGNSGSNLLDGQGGADTMRGFLGNDTYVVDHIGDRVDETDGGGADAVHSSVSFTLGDNIEVLNLTGAGAIDGTGNGLDNVLTGNGAANVLDGGAGADEMAGGLGNDTYGVDNGGDRIVEAAGGGTDTVRSSISYTLGAELEHLTLTGLAAIDGAGNALANVLTGNDAANRLDGGAGADAMFGGLGDDIYVIDNDFDSATETSATGGTDTIVSSVSAGLWANIENLTLTGSANLVGYGNALANVLWGNSGGNLLDGQSGADLMRGFLGDDTYVVDNSGDRVDETDGGGFDTVISSIDFTLDAAFEHLTLLGTAVTGTGNAAHNIIIGNASNNVLSGHDGSDRLDGGLGSDSMTGGTGDDTYVVDNVGDSVNEAANAGSDTVISSITYVLAPTLEVLTLSGTAHINGTGNAQTNTINGNSGNNVLDGGGAADLMFGSFGDDIYIVSEMGDRATETHANGGTDTVLSAISFDLTDYVENLTLTGTASTWARGNGLANTIIGNAGHNTIFGGLGADLMRGGAGNDTYEVENAGDRIEELANEGTDIVNSSLSYVLGANLENLNLTGAGAISGTGNALNNAITGNAAANALDGGEGNDTLTGGLGADRLTGGAGNDTYVIDATDTLVELAGGGTDTVVAGHSYTLLDEFEILTLTGIGTIHGTGNAANNTLNGNAGNNR
ncbi:M10 family metallopeptidase C-terminal domain-containing protein, partial [Allosphingosinicella sp.]|uniref:M10 family metallopeptidase C-terminal domain-containing protein n=1 Tax=Allosphingosinicella sp. TaxID=2823234 RepID=UPI002F00F758